MSEVKEVTLQEFLWLLTRAQRSHLLSGEPIPAISNEGRDKIEYCLHAPFMGFGDEDYHPTFDEKAAILLYDLCKLHCLMNGNKRLVIETTVFFAYKNNRFVYVSRKVLKDMAIKIVESDPNDKDNVIWWISMVFYGGIRKRTRMMNFLFVIRYLPKITIYLVDVLIRKIVKWIKSLMPVKH